MIKFILIFISLLFFSCASEKKLVKLPVKKMEKRNSLDYIPQFASLVIKNNKLNKKVFNRYYSPSVIYEFELNKSTYFLSNTKESSDASLKLNYYYLSPIQTYETNSFQYNLSEFDFYFNRNLFRIFSLNDNKLVIFSTGDDSFKGEMPSDIKIFNNKKTDIIVHEEHPLFYDYFVSLVSFKYKFKTIKSYFLIKYLEEIEKTVFHDKKLENSYILIVTLSDFEEISSFKKLIAKTYNHHTINLKDVYSSKDKKMYIFFNGDKIIFSKNINSLKMIDKLNKIPLTKINELNKNNGYVITENKKYLSSVFKIFNEISFKSKIVYYFFDYKE